MNMVAELTKSLDFSYMAWFIAVGMALIYNKLK